MQSNKFSWEGYKISLKGMPFIAIACLIIYISDYITNNIILKILHYVSWLSVIIGTVIIYIGGKKHYKEMFRK